MNSSITFAAESGRKKTAMVRLYHIRRFRDSWIGRQHRNIGLCHGGSAATGIGVEGVRDLGELRSKLLVLLFRLVSRAQPTGKS
jgi:hypothetical protein